MSGRDALSEAASEAGKVTGHLQDATKAQLTFSKATKAHARGYADLGRAGSGAWKAIGGAADASITKTASGLSGMLSMLGPIGVGVGTAVGAALAGVTAAKALADAAVTRQRSAFGLGTTPGRQASFSVYGQQFFGDGQSALQSAANVQSNFGNAGALGALGIDFNKARGMSKSDLAFEMLKSGVRIANASPNLPLGNNPLLSQYAALTGDKDFDQLRNAMAMGPGALDAAQAATNRNAGRMELDRGAVANAALLKKSVEGAGVTAQSWLINNTSGLDPKIAHGIDALSGGGGSLPALATAANKAARALDNISNSKTVQGHEINPLDPMNLPGSRTTVKAWNWLKRNASGGISATKGSASDAIIAVANKLGVDPLLALAGAGHESNMNPKSRVRDFYSDGSFAGYSTGLYQLNDNGKGHGMSIADMMDPTKNAMKELPEYARVAKAHPDWSPGQIAFSAEGAAAGPGGAWKKSYIDDVNTRYNRLVNQQRNSRPPTILVEVSNPTQSRVSVSVKGAHP